MLKRSSLKRYVRQTFALIEKNLYLDLFVKSTIITRFLNPIVSLFVFIFIFNIIFSSKGIMKFGYWNSSNFVLFILLAFCVQIIRQITQYFLVSFTSEKYWKTLSAIMVAPVNKNILLFSSLISELIIYSLPLGIILIILMIFFPITIIFFLLSLLVFFLIYLILASIGLIIGVYSISNEKYVQYLLLILNVILIFSCLNYPKEIFPSFIQFFILLNPFYYIFDLLRLIWYLGIDFDSAIIYITPLHIIYLLFFSIFSPIIAVKVFNKIYKKYGITGY